MERTNINCTVGIYDTWYTFDDYGEKIVVKVPSIKWVYNSGSLSFEHRVVTDLVKIAAIREMVANDELANSEGETIDNLIY
jgi:hypothetical protein